MDTLDTLRQEISARLSDAAIDGRAVDVTVLAIRLAANFQPGGIPYTKICAEIEKALAARLIEPLPC